MAGEARRARPRTRIDAARRTAYDALLQVQRDDAYLNLALARLMSQPGRALTESGPDTGLDERDRAFATELAHGTARMQGLYDAVLDVQVKGGVASLQPEVAVAMRLGCHQLLSMRVPPHAAVATTVELVREAVGERPVRMVNAVLRKVAKRPMETWIGTAAPPAGDDRVGYLAVRYSHPRWMVEEFAHGLGDLDEVERALEADNAAPSVSLVVRPGLAEVGELLQAGGQPGRWSPYAVTLAGGDPGSIPAVREGRAGVQDEGSQLAALALARADVEGGDDARWLDLCAGPGGKAALLAGLARERGAYVVAGERQPHRALLVQSALRGYPNGADVVVADGVRPPFGAGTFDRVLVDAPCTGLGALRRRPEARWRRLPEDVNALVPLQRALLRSALGLVRAGGVVAYVTCSPVLAETRGVVEAVLADRADVVEEAVGPLLPEVSDLGDGPSAQLWPHRHGTDAMFIAVLRRR